MTVGTGERLRTLETKVDVTMDNVQLLESNEKSELLFGCELRSDLKWHTQVEKKTGGTDQPKVHPPLHDQEPDYLCHVKQHTGLLFTFVWRP